ncbi:MAG TPA: GNAT family N-acetyltransferase [Terriglobales bacterium]|nr:GNAT family N-acetyltransferase [Terriglobales bacterium]
MLTTRRLRLRRLRPGDAEAVFRYCSDPRVTRYMVFETHRSLAETRRIVRRLEASHRRTGAPHWAITLRGSGKLIGMCGFLPLETKHRRGEFGYWLGRPHWGQGYATEAVGALLAFGFRRLKLNRLQARVVVGNRASARVLQKAGMKLEGTLRQFEQIKGKFPDLHLYSMLQREFIRRERRR